MLLRLVLELLRLTCGVALLLRLVLELLRLTCGVALLRLVLVLELLRFTCGVALLLRLVLTLEVLRLTVGADELLERETAAVWLLLVVLPPCERLRPWATASDALKIRHPMRATLVMIFVTEVFIIVDVLIVQQSDFKFSFVCLLDDNTYTKFNPFLHPRPQNCLIGHNNATNRRFL